MCLKAFSGVWDQSWIFFGERVGNRLTFQASQGSIFLAQQATFLTEARAF